jgi:hypothetical protein
LLVLRPTDEKPATKRRWRALCHRLKWFWNVNM